MDDKLTVEEVATRLLQAGYVDNEVDARVAALKIIIAVESGSAARRSGDEMADGHAVPGVRR